MSKRRQAGDWVWLMPNSGFVGESHRLRAEIQPEDDPPPCVFGCGDIGCREWSTLLTEDDGGTRHTLCHVSECRMLDEPFREGASTTCECDGCLWCIAGCDMDAATVHGGEHLCAGCADIWEDE